MIELIKRKYYNCKIQIKVKRVNKNEIFPKVLRASKFQATKQTPNSEAVKNQYFYRIMVFIYGAATIVLDTGHIVCKKNDILYLLPDTPYRILDTHGGFAVINIYFDYLGNTQTPEELAYKNIYQNEFDPMLCPKRYDFTDFPKLNEVYVIHNDTEIVDLSFKILKEYEKEDPSSRRLISLLMSCIIEKMCLHKDNPGRKNDKYQQIINYIKENAHLKITAEDLEERFHYHKNHINRIVKSETGMNLKSFILKTKIDLADKLFEDADMSVTEIANYLNFFDASHFLKIYKRAKQGGNLCYTKKI
ncbi:MAG: helix-turn-helix transcriptional regulator [Clostridia bacterium]|nr:helix-turn-helix transcriptional regulator [Clostridia bacterium]